ncbi:MAG TPA: threonine synthase, partial [Candidatus Binatia bacterium]|nr:threonine synthase [Candidatus Binatia bacterium]
MTFAKEIVCPRCDNRFRLDQLLNLCSCGSPLLVRYDLRKAAATLTKPSLQGRSATLWRYRELLPVQDDVNVVSLGEGFTPLLEAKTVAHE